jgi:hypothetical protein
MLKHRMIALVASVGLASGLMSTVAAASASATSSHCKVEITKVKAWELQDGDGKDEIRFELGDDTYGTFNFTQGQVRTETLGHPHEVTTSSSVPFDIWERDYPFTKDIDTASLSCVDGGHNAELVGAGADYEVWYTTSHV